MSLDAAPRRIPMCETLELVIRLEPDSLEQLRLEQASRDELLQHVKNLAYMVLHQSKRDDQHRRLYVFEWLRDRGLQWGDRP